MDPSTGQMIQERIKVKLPAVNYYIKLLGSHVISPIELFYLRFYNYPASFFPLEVLHQSKVVPQIVLIENTFLS
jgi:hypothetical protein